MINEQLYNLNSKDAINYFKDKQKFEIYHEGFKDQVKKWPKKPLDLIATWIQQKLAKKLSKNLSKKSKNIKIGDFGCGKAELCFKCKKLTNFCFFNFDLVSSNDQIIACDISKVPLENGFLDVVVFCLSLMGTNFPDFIFEANRVLKKE